MQFSVTILALFLSVCSVVQAGGEDHSLVISKPVSVGEGDDCTLQVTVTGTDPPFTVSVEVISPSAPDIVVGTLNASGPIDWKPTVPADALIQFVVRDCKDQIAYSGNVTVEQCGCQPKEKTVTVTTTKIWPTTDFETKTEVKTTTAPPETKTVTWTTTVHDTVTVTTPTTVRVTSTTTDIVPTTVTRTLPAVTVTSTTTRIVPTTTTVTLPAVTRTLPPVTDTITITHTSTSTSTTTATTTATSISTLRVTSTVTSTSTITTTAPRPVFTCDSTLDNV